MVVARSWRIKSTVTGKPTTDNFQLQAEELGDLKVGDVLTKTLFITVDPYLRPLITRARLPIGSIIPSQQVGKVIESKDDDYPVGTILLSRCGWCDYARFNPKSINAGASIDGRSKTIEKPPEIGELSPSFLLGACGMPGVTAYWGFLDICKVPIVAAY